MLLVRKLSIPGMSMMLFFVCRICAGVWVTNKADLKCAIVRPQVGMDEEVTRVVVAIIGGDTDQQRRRPVVFTTELTLGRQSRLWRRQ
jgi:hypothetical protein